MPLPLLNLHLGGIHATDNWTLQTLYKAVVAYNQMGDKAPPNQRVEKLHLIAQVAGIYVTSKPPQAGKYKNGQRWDGIHDLLAGVGVEIKAAGARTLTGPQDYRKISGSQRSYWLEFLDPMHRPGYDLSPRYERWLRDPVAIKTKTSFWSHIGTARFGGDPTLNVAYLQERGESARYRVQFDGKGCLRDTRGVGARPTAGEPYDTRTHETVFSSTGWAIFVASPTGELYSASHILGKLHHSSFLSGRPVMAAGEMVVDDGTIKVITAKSGHYMPTPDDLLRFVQAFPEIPACAIIRPDMTDLKQAGRIHFYTVGDFRANGLGATALSREEVNWVVPNWARNAKSNREVFSHVPALQNKRMLRQLAH